MDGRQIWIALERSSGESSKDVMSISVSHLIWKEEIMLSKMKYQNQNGILNKKVAIHRFFSLSNIRKIGKNRRVMPGAEEVADLKRPQKPMMKLPCKEKLKKDRYECIYMREWLVEKKILN